ncbi:MAG TPA: enoyl-CoA hydratase/isomerase family protein [Thermoanaerobaculia bacterium]|nr:enoyl-CoA hydratase/isomerase family protein [Thermoanaerobaculia bacterium]
MSRFTVTGDGHVVFDDGGMNLLSSAALRELLEVLSRLRGCEFSSGRPALFAAGADMAEMASFTAADAFAFSTLGQSVMNAIESLPGTTIAYIDGDCFGGALDLALAFDRRIATPRSRFSHPGARLGIVTGFGGTTRWRKVLTPASARQLFLANRVFGAAEALEMGLVDLVG